MRGGGKGGGCQEMAKFYLLGQEGVERGGALTHEQRVGTRYDVKCQNCPLEWGSLSKFGTIMSM